MSATIPFIEYKDHKFLNLETFRRSGVGVPTPVWFLQDGERLYVRTPARSGKVKRVRNMGRARIAPCDRAGKLLGGWREVRASLVNDENTLWRVNQKLNKKYGLLKRAIDFFSALQKTGYAVILLEEQQD